jgi:hypothetical protein
MARPIKRGIDYFPLDIRWPDSIKFIIAKHGVQGYGTLILIWRRIYEINGYYADWTEKNLLIFCQEYGLNVDNVRDLLKTCLNEGIFSARLYKEKNVLTSDGTQSRWLSVVTNSKRKDCHIDPSLDLLSESFPAGKPQFPPEETPVSPGESTQRRVKESKEENTISAATAAPAVSLVDYEGVNKSDKRPIWNFIRDHRPRFIEPYIDFWNAFAAETNTPTVKKITESRRRKFAVRIKDPDFKIEAILREAKASPFLFSGKWFSFDWLIENDKNYLKILEGNYKGTGNNRQEKLLPAALQGEKLAKGLDADLRYLLERYQEPDFQLEYISPEFYDRMTARNFLPIGFADQFAGTEDDKKRLAVETFLKSQLKPAI